MSAITSYLYHQQKIVSVKNAVVEQGNIQRQERLTEHGRSSVNRATTNGWNTRVDWIFDPAGERA